MCSKTSRVENGRNACCQHSLQRVMLVVEGHGRIVWVLHHHAMLILAYLVAAPHPFVKQISAGAERAGLPAIAGMTAAIAYQKRYHGSKTSIGFQAAVIESILALLFLLNTPDDGQYQRKLAAVIESTSTLCPAIESCRAYRQRSRGTSGPTSLQH
jgi:hypothetical protein